MHLHTVEYCTLCTCIWNILDVQRILNIVHSLALTVLVHYPWRFIRFMIMVGDELLKIVIFLQSTLWFLRRNMFTTSRTHGTRPAAAQRSQTATQRLTCMDASQRTSSSVAQQTAATLPEPSDQSGSSSHCSPSPSHSDSVVCFDKCISSLWPLACCIFSLLLCTPLLFSLYSYVHSTLNFNNQSSSCKFQAWCNLLHNNYTIFSLNSFTIMPESSLSFLFKIAFQFLIEILGCTARLFAPARFLRTVNCHFP